MPEAAPAQKYKSGDTDTVKLGLCWRVTGLLFIQELFIIRSYLLSRVIPSCKVTGVTFNLSCLSSIFNPFLPTGLAQETIQ